MRPGEDGADALDRLGLQEHAAPHDEEDDLGPTGDEAGSTRGLQVHFVADATVPDGERVTAGSVFVKVWHLSMGLAQGGAPWPCEVGRAPRLVRDDIDAESFEGARCVGCRALPGEITFLPREDVPSPPEATVADAAGKG
eukprot:6472547-Prymnesium_polylepis.1